MDAMTTQSWETTPKSIGSMYSRGASPKPQAARAIVTKSRIGATTAEPAATTLANARRRWDQRPWEGDSASTPPTTASHANIQAVTNQIAIASSALAAIAPIAARTAATTTRIVQRASIHDVTLRKSVRRVRDARAVWS